MVRLFVRHPVTDYAQWRRAYDDFDAERRTMGVMDHAVYRAVDDGNAVTVSHDFADAASAQAFAGNPRLREVMTSAGVAAPPTIWFVQPS